MNETEIEDMLSELIEELDYDIWKDYFLSGNYPEELERLKNIVRFYLDD